MKTKSLLRSIFMLSLLYPALCFAHSEEAGNGFVSGMLHPIFGFDHLLAMLSVGIISAQLGRYHVWTVPGLFVTFMVTGGILGANGIEIPFVELGIALSVIVLGLGIAVVHTNRSYAWIVPIVMLFVAFFGSLHGHAHGVEMPRSASPIFYSFGFIVSTSLIHLLGVLIGYLFTNRKSLQQVNAYLGTAVSLAGLVILFRL